ncbi:MAG: hypothetical protein V4714_06295 [Bacteroidota bacterium]
MSNAPLGKNPLGGNAGSGNPLEELREIRSMMERSSRFISLSGLSGIFAGVFALVGAGAAYWYLDLSFPEKTYHHFLNPRIFTFLFSDALLVLVLSLAVGIYLTTRQARRKGQHILDKTSKRMLFNLAIPLAAGGVFTLALLPWAPVLIAPATLIFYGLALINASKFTLDDIRYLGFCEIVLGLISSFFTGYSLFFWAFGFGILHIIYGTAMYHKYEK